MIGPVALSPNVRAPFNAKRAIWRRRRRWISDVFVSAEEFSLHRILLEKCESAAQEKKQTKKKSLSVDEFVTERALERIVK